MKKSGTPNPTFTLSSANAMKERLAGLDSPLASVLLCVSELVKEAAAMLKDAPMEECGTHNKFGDSQLQVAFDPIDGSSIAGANFAVGSIFSIWPGATMVAFDPIDGSSVAGANFAVGSIFSIWPDATMVAFDPIDRSSIAGANFAVGSIFSIWPGATMGEIKPLQPMLFMALGLCWYGLGLSKTYSKLVADWIAANFTLRYTGGMVPDVHHIIAKGGGVFCSPRASNAPAKLRLVYECAPLAFIIEAAGGASHDGQGSMLDARIESTAIKSIVCLGSTELVEQSIPAMKDG
eukprot:gene13014-3519_t